MTSDAATMSSSASGTPSISLDDVGDQVLAGVAASLVEQIDEVAPDPLGGGLGHRCQAVVAGVAVLELVDPALQVRAGRRLLGRRQPDQVEEDLHRAGQASSWAMSISSRSFQPRDELADDLADVRSCLAMRRGRKCGCTIFAELVVPRVVDVGQEARARSGPWRWRRCRCPRSSGTCRGPWPPRGRPPSGRAPTSSTSRCRRPAPPPASSGTPRTGPPGTPGCTGRTR